MNAINDFGEKHMAEERPTISAEFWDNDITILSKDPLIGILELASSDDQAIELTLNRRDAEALLGILVQFLSQGEGRDFPKKITKSTPMQ